MRNIVDIDNNINEAGIEKNEDLEKQEESEVEIIGDVEIDMVIIGIVFDLFLTKPIDVSWSDVTNISMDCSEKEEKEVLIKLFINFIIIFRLTKYQV